MMNREKKLLSNDFAVTLLKVQVDFKKNTTPCRIACFR